mmetsp:Transcript_4987/g.8037  ORF Transcript_4987/g.8037 Transcript_4987/m.8037 type:complete len:288 (+) Transcript_4987:385-1248(+)
MVVSLSMSNGGEFLLIFGVHVSADLQKQHGGIDLAARCCEVDGGAQLLVAGVDVGSPLHQTTDAVHVVVGCRHVQGGRSFLVSAIHPYAIGVKELHEIVSSELGHDVEGCVAPLCFSRQIGATAVAKLCKTHVTGLTSMLEECLICLHIHRIDLCGLQQALEHVHQHRAVPGEDLLQVEGLCLVLHRFERCLQIKERICSLAFSPFALLRTWAGVASDQRSSCPSRLGWWDRRLRVTISSPILLLRAAAALLDGRNLPGIPSLCRKNCVQQSQVGCHGLLRLQHSLA